MLREEVTLITFSAKVCWWMFLNCWVCRYCHTIDLSWELTVFIFTFSTFGTLLTRSLARDAFSLFSWAIEYSKLILTIVTLSLTLPLLLKEVADITTTRSTTNTIIFFGWFLAQNIFISLTSASGTWIITLSTLIVSHLFVYSKKVVVPLKLYQTFLTVNRELIRARRLASINLFRLQEVILFLEWERTWWHFTPTFGTVVGIIILAITAWEVTFQFISFGIFFPDINHLVNIFIKDISSCLFIYTDC